MKRYRKVFGMTAALAALVCAAWFCIYHNRKSSDNLPDLKSISVMSEAEINEIVCGYKRNQLSYIWKKPDKTAENADMWSLGDDRYLQINYNSNDKAVVCSIFVELFPADTKTVKVSYSAGTAAETEIEPTRQEITDVMDWASSLDLELQDYEEGEAPNQVYAGGEAYLFDINNGEGSFSYLWINNYYIYKTGEWYLVKNPTLPPIDFIPAARPASFHPES